MIDDEGMGLGDVVAKAAALVGVTEERLSALLGRPCGCSERREKWNQLGGWAARIVRGKVEGAVGFFEEIVGDWTNREV